MCVIVNDASCLIDLRKGGLLGVLGNLSYRLIVPLPIRVDAPPDYSVTGESTLGTLVIRREPLS